MTPTHRSTPERPATHRHTPARRNPAGGGRRVSGDRGMVTIWALGMVMMLGFFGWMSLDLWSVFAERRELAAAADQSARAAATALDVDGWRTTGIPQLDPTLAEALAIESLAAHDLRAVSNVTINATPTQVVVVLEADIASGLVSLFNLGGGDLRVQVTGIGTPRTN